MKESINLNQIVSFRADKNFIAFHLSNGKKIDCKSFKYYLDYPLIQGLIESAIYRLSKSFMFVDIEFLKYQIDAFIEDEKSRNGYTEELMNKFKINVCMN